MSVQTGISIGEGISKYSEESIKKHDELRVPIKAISGDTEIITSARPKFQLNEIVKGAWPAWERHHPTESWDRQRIFVSEQGTILTILDQSDLF